MLLFRFADSAKRWAMEELPGIFNLVPLPSGKDLEGGETEEPPLSIRREGRNPWLLRSEIPWNMGRSSFPGKIYAQENQTPHGPRQQDGQTKHAPTAEECDVRGRGH